MTLLVNYNEVILRSYMTNGELPMLSLIVLCEKNVIERGLIGVVEGIRTYLLISFGDTKLFL